MSLNGVGALAEERNDLVGVCVCLKVPWLGQMRVCQEVISFKRLVTFVA